MDVPEKSPNTTSETVLEPKPKKTRKFTWTDKRKAQFEKMLAANREQSKKHKKGDGKAEKTVDEKEEVDVENENPKGTEKEEKQSKNIVKRIMDPHYLSRPDRHTIGTTSDGSSESEEADTSESDSDDSSDSESSVEIKKKAVKKPKAVKKDWKLERKVTKLRAKNKQLQKMFLNKANKKYKYSSENQSDESDQEPVNTRVPVKVSSPIYFC